MRTSPAPLALFLAFFFAACNPTGRNPGHRPDAGAACVEGAHRCQGNVWNVCMGGVLMPQTTCSADQACSDDLGCTACPPGGTTCNGDNIVRCDDHGQPTQSQAGTCAPQTCVMYKGAPMCVGPCDPKALAKSYTGCVYYAVDLPQWGLSEAGFGTIAADQQFAVAIANPWMVPVDVVVERDDAALNSQPKLGQVTKSQVPPGGVKVLPLPQREVDGYVNGKARSRSMRTPNAYRITTNRPASVYQFNPEDNPNAYSNDASLLIPQNALDASYVVLGWPGFGGGVDAGGLHIDTDNRSFVAIVGTRFGTKVRVTPSTEVVAGDNVPALHKGMSHTFTLGEFEVLTLEGADFKVGGATDFTGTRIEATAPIAVWSGIQCITINPMKPPDQGTCCCDHLEEQLFPRSSLGQEYVVVRSQGRNNMSADPEFFRVLALADGTDVTTSLPAPHDHFTLGAGAMHQIEMMVGDDFIVSANKAVMVGQFQVSQDSSLGMDGDPSFELVPPVAQYQNEYIFLVPSSYLENYVLVAIPTGADLHLDGTLVSGCERVSVGAAAQKMFDAMRCPVRDGAHTLASSASFGLVVEGWGPGPVSYGYAGGMQFQQVNHDCTSDGNCPVAEFCSGGTCVPMIQ